MSEVDRPAGGYGRQQYFVRPDASPAGSVGGGGWLVYFGPSQSDCHFIARLRAADERAVLRWCGPHRAVTFLPELPARRCANVA